MERSTSTSTNNGNSPKMTTAQKRDDVTDTPEEASVEERPMDERKEDRRQEMLLCNVAEDIQSNLDENLCDYTLQAMGDLCGISPTDKDPDAPRQIPQHAFRTGAEEHTSIEVEYVAPRLKQPISRSAAAAAAPPVPENTTKKSLLLQNISLKAREDYEKEVRSEPQDYQDDEYAQNTIYNTLSPPEKRKFLKLINMGVSPSEAADRVLKERREGVVAQEQAKTKEKKGLFRHFKKSKQEEDDPEIPKSEFASSGINYYDAIRKVDVEGYQEPQDDDLTTTSNKKKKKSILPKFKKKRFSRLSGVEPKPANAASSSSPKNAAAAAASSPSNNNAAIAGAAVVGAADVGLAAIATSPSASHDWEDPADDDWMPPPPPPEETPNDAAAAAAAYNLGAAAMQSPFMTEEEVLRDLAMSDRGALDIREEKKVEDDMAAQLLAPMGAQSSMQGQVPVQITNDAQDLDDLETYLNSTDLLSSYGGASVADHLTVVSGKSYKTSATNYTAASTRSRRPGQAQKRLEQQKVGENTNRKARPSSHQMRGWQETMQQAAAENNRQWDPKHGWVDYANPNDPMPDTTAEPEYEAPLPLDLDHRGRAVADAAAPTETPTSKDPRKNGASTESQQGWVESMKAASARLLQAGKRWDPDHGWVGLEGPGKTTPRQDDGNINTQSASDTADFGIGNIAPGLLDTEGQDEKLMIYEDENSENEIQARNDGRYVQIGDAGSIHSHKGAKGANDATKAPSVLVDVKKEKVDADDAAFFSKRRGDGPVDLDEMEDDEKDVPKSSSRAIPKLKGPKRDTSPVSRSKHGMVTPEAKDTEAKGSVGKLSHMWETRSSTAGGGEATTKSSEWKAFLAKKQQAESEANRQRDLGESDGAFPGDLSPIRKDNESEVASEASTAAMQPNTFMGRLQACAAPIFPAKNSMNGASPRSSAMRFVPPALCGRPDAIAEEDDTTIGTETTPRSLRSRSRSRPRSSKSDVSSVISDEMSGSKAAFLESMAMKAVVSSKKSKRRSTGSEAGVSSVASTPRSSTGGTPRGSTSDNKWQQFLEKKKSESGNGSVVGARSQASTSVSRAAEKYAAKKVDEMMETQRSQSESQGSGSFQGRPMEEATGAFPKPARSTASSAVFPSRIRTSLPFEPPKSASQIAAEEAKAARLSALRASLSPRGQATESDI
jgi:hypothetical protein